MNVIAEVAEFLHKCINDRVHVPTEIFGLINEVLQALIEMCAGNTVNQLVILDNHLVDTVNCILLMVVEKVNILAKFILLILTCVNHFVVTDL